MDFYQNDTLFRTYVFLHSLSLYRVYESLSHSLLNPMILIVSLIILVVFSEILSNLSKTVLLSFPIIKFDFTN